MSTDPVMRLPTAFGWLLARLRRERNWSAEQLATAAGLTSDSTVTEMECGDYVPSLTEFFRIAHAFSEQPAILMTDLIAAWRTDPTEYVYKSRASDFARVYRLGYHHAPGDFRELPHTYNLIDPAQWSAKALNARRRSKSLPLLDTVLIYVRLTHVAVHSEAEGQL